jgi:hypothetical protein
MTPNKQVSPAIRILRGERDASARATHLEAATRKYLVTTIERKQMSTKTNFKRIALVAVAALGLGVLSSIPSQAAVTGTLAVTNTNGTATTATADSTTAGSLKVRWLATGNTDSVVISTNLNSAPSSSTFIGSLRFVASDTLTAQNAVVLLPALGGLPSAGDTAVITTATAGYSSGTFLYQLSSTTGLVAGTYTFTTTITPYNALTGVESTKVVTQDVSIVVTVPSSASTTASPVYSAAYIGTTSIDSSTAADATTAAVGTASVTPAGAVFVKLRNAAGTATTNVLDSLTVTIDKGNVAGVNTGGVGRNIIINYAPSGTTGGAYVYFYPDGSTGTATITIATKNAGTFTKTLSWYGTDVKSIVAQQRLSVMSVGAVTSVVRAQAFDANLTNLASSTALYAYSSDTSVVSTYGAACSAAAVSASDGLWYADCPLTGVKAGTVTITIRDAATVALSTVASNAVSVRVSTGVATSFTLTTDKASYAPGEKGYLIVTVKDAAGLVMPKRSSTATLASGGISSTAQLGAASDTLIATSFATDRSSSGSNSPSSNDPIKFYVFYAPSTAGTVTFSALGASTFSAASQSVATTATITVADSASAALAAVSALAVTVASLKTLITTLTNLVLKIQKKVKA